MKRSRAASGSGGGGGYARGRAGGRPGPGSGGASSFQAKFGQRILKTSGDGSYVRLHAPASRELAQGGAAASREALKQQQRERQHSGKRPEEIRKDYGNAAFAVGSSTMTPQAATTTSLPPVRVSAPLAQMSESPAPLVAGARVQIRPLLHSNGILSSTTPVQQASAPREQYTMPEPQSGTYPYMQTSLGYADGTTASSYLAAAHAEQSRREERPSLADLQRAVEETPHAEHRAYQQQHHQHYYQQPHEKYQQQDGNPSPPGGYMYGYASSMNAKHQYHHEPPQRGNEGESSPQGGGSHARDAPGRARGAKKRDPDVFEEEETGKSADLPPKDVVNERLVKTEKDRLFYSRKHRAVSYKPCTTKEYLKNKPEKYYELGKLQVDLNTEEVTKKREKMERMKSYGAKLRVLNKQPPSPSAASPAESSAPGWRASPRGGSGNNQEEDALANQGRRVYQRQHPEVREQALREKRKAQSARQRALEFAKSVPKPRVRVTKTPTAESASAPRFPEDRISGKAMTELERLELEHDRAREEIEAIRRDFAGHHLEPELSTTNK